MKDFEDNSSDDETSSKQRTCGQIELEKYLQLKLIQRNEQDIEEEEKNGGYDPLKFWRKEKNNLPLLSLLTQKILAVPASSAAVERTLSAAGVIITQRRATLNTRT
ncbi:unnamed protein product, partial [Didymodactylos carnosus]